MAVLPPPAIRVSAARTAAMTPRENRIACTVCLLRGNHTRPLGLARILELRFEPALEAAVDPVEVDVDHRRDEQRQQLRDAQAADHGDAERLTQLCAGSGADRDGQRA